MGRKIHFSRKSILALPDDDFIDQVILSYEETCSFGDDDIESLRLNGAFPPDEFLRPFDPLIQPDFVSPMWMCFPKYPFSLGLRYPFPGIVTEFFRVTRISCIAAMPIFWRILYWIDQANHSKGLDIILYELACVYDLTTFGNSRFLLNVRTLKSPLVLKTKHNDGAWKGRYFFVRRDPVPMGISYLQIGLRMVGSQWFSSWSRNIILILFVS